MRIVPRIPITPALLTSSNVSESGEPAAYAAGTTYGLDSDTAPVRVLDPATHLIYRSRQLANTGNTPATSPSWWQVVGYTNRLRMFDEKVSSQTTNPDSVEATVSVGQVADTAVFLNLDGDAIQVQVTDPTDGLVYDQTQPLADPSASDYWEYCFGDIPVVTKAIFQDLPPYPGAAISVKVTSTGATAKVGVMGLGNSFEPGLAQWGMQMGIDDFSVKNTDEFGTTAITERDYSDTMNLTADIEPGLATTLMQLLQRLRATPTFVLGSEVYADSLLYGWPDSWARTFEALDHHQYTISWKGLT